MQKQIADTEKHWKKKFLFFLVSQSITLFGSTLVQMAVIWYVTLQTGSGIWVAAFSVCSYLPQFIVSFLGGVWADRYSRKKMIQIADGFVALVTLLLYGLLHIWEEGRLSFGLLLGMTVLRSLGAGIQTPAVYAILPQIVPGKHYMRCSGIQGAMQSVVNFAAPMAAGGILTILPFRSTLLVDVITALVGIGIFSVIHIPKEQVWENRTVREDLKTGFSYVFSHQEIGKILLLYGKFVFLCVPAGYLAGLLVSRIYGDTYWYLSAVELVGFAGMTAGGLLIGIWGGWKKKSMTLSFGLALFGGMSIGMGAVSDFLAYLGMMFVYGNALTIVQTTINALIQEKAEVKMQGRVFGLMNSAYSGFLPLGMAVFGPLADLVPLQGIMVGSGVLLLLMAGSVFHFTKDFKKIKNRWY